jgi:hypothetical protein
LSIWLLLVVVAVVEWRRPNSFRLEVAQVDLGLVQVFL